MIQSPDRPLAKIPGAGSCRPVYRDGATNHCPACGRCHWLLGRFSSECAFCGTALPLQEGGMREAFTHDKPVFFTRGSEGEGSVSPGDDRAH